MSLHKKKEICCIIYSRKTLFQFVNKEGPQTLNTCINLRSVKGTTGTKVSHTHYSNLKAIPNNNNNFIVGRVKWSKDALKWKKKRKNCLFFCLHPCRTTSCWANVCSQHDVPGCSHLSWCMLWKTSPSVCLACQRSQVELRESQRHVNIVCCRGIRLQCGIEPLWL